MILCSFCNHGNLEGELFCVECGNPLDGSQHIETRKFEELQQQQTAGARPFWGTTQFSKTATVIIKIESAQQPLVLEENGRFTVGRVDIQTGNYPDIDLTPYGGIEQGVSRMHACFRRTDEALTIEDMNSANGTYLNGQRMVPNQPRVLQDGDEIRFGKLVTRIYFK
ncbi:MAG: hypothetical protein CUN55_09700 [Phototrophicales bacterium]|nr:MAG: hypothetical protein CUN55_09700 [Phototrophicales bacterium]